MSTPRVRLKYACASRGKYGLNYPAAGYVDQGVRLIRTTDLVGGVLSPAELGIYVPEEAVDGESRLKTGDLLLSRSGTIGRAFLAPPATEGMAFAGFLVRFRPKPGTLGKYLYYCTQSNEFQAAVNADAVSSTIRNFNAEKYENLAVPLPDLDEQRAIVDYLDRETQKIDELITEQRGLVETLRERRQVVIEQSVGHGIDAMIEMKDSTLSWISQVPAHWDVANIRRYAIMKTGHTPSRSNTAYWVDCRIPWVTLADVWQMRSGTRMYVDHTESKISLVGLANSAAELLPAGTVMLSRTASVGFVGIMADNMATSQDYWNWVCGPSLHPEYLAWVLRGMRQEFDAAMAGSTHKTIYQTTAASFRIPVPPLAEQKRIACYINEQTSRIDELISESEDLIALSQERRSALITAAVTGQIDVRTTA